MKSIFLKRFINSSPLESLHIKAGGQLGNFHGWNLPMQYAGQKIKDSAVHCRTKASLFDVSHMLQTKISGPNALKLIENLTPLDVRNLKPNSGSLTIFTLPNGGIQDDLIVNKLDDDCNFYVVSNCARADVDLPYMLKEATRLGDVHIETIEKPLVALQGPQAEYRAKTKSNFFRIFYRLHFLIHLVYFAKSRKRRSIKNLFHGRVHSKNQQPHL